MILISLDEVEEVEALAVVIKVTFAKTCEISGDKNEAMRKHTLILIALDEVVKAGHSLLDSR